MNKLGIVIFAQNTNVDYVKQASVLAMSIAVTNPELPVSIVTNDSVPDSYLFDKIIPIPFTDDAKDSAWKVENRWKIYHATPYEETIVMDSDMLVLQDISSWVKHFQQYDLFFTSKVYTYQDEQVTNSYYRKTFVSNDLPNLYSGLYFFRKCDFAHNFFDWVEIVTQNWELFYGKLVPEDYPGRYSFDVTVSIVAKILDCDNDIVNEKAKFPSFTHMKPMIQNWQSPQTRWQDCVGVYMNSECCLKIGNHQQRGIFHYTENDFIERNKIDKIYMEYLYE